MILVSVLVSCFTFHLHKSYVNLDVTSSDLLLRLVNHRDFQFHFSLTQVFFFISHLAFPKCFETFLERTVFFSNDNFICGDFLLALLSCFQMKNSASQNWKIAFVALKWECLISLSCNQKIPLPSSPPLFFCTCSIIYAVLPWTPFIRLLAATQVK